MLSEYAIGAEAMDEWTVYRVTGDALNNLEKGKHLTLTQ